MMRPLPAAPTKADRKRLDTLAAQILAEAASSKLPNAYAASGYAEENISIVHQQLRCANLTWALHWSGKLKPGEAVAIVGASFSGLMLAASIALVSDVIVFLFEKGDRLLPRFRDKGHRHLSPLLNSRWLGNAYDTRWGEPEFQSPIFDWKPGSASHVAEQWIAEFQSYERNLPIITFLDTLVRFHDVLPTATGLRLDFRTEDYREHQPIDVAVLIDATGFGEETNRHGLTDFSYWESGHRLIYDHFEAPARVLISGCGDSGVIEALHYAIADFKHEYVEALWPSDWTGFAQFLDEGVSAARLDDVFEHAGFDDLETLPELSWWLQMTSLVDQNPHYDFLAAKAHNRPIFEAIESALASDLTARFPHYATTKPNFLERQSFLEDLIPDRQLAARRAVLTVAEDWISLNLRAFAETIELPPGFDRFLAKARPGVNIILNALTPTPYTRQLSPLNVWFMRLVTSFPSVRYQPGAIDHVDRRAETKDYSVKFVAGGQMAVDRVVSRYGPGRATSVLALEPRDTYQRGPLLDQSRYRPSREKRFIAAPRELISLALDDFRGVRPPDLPSDVSKKRFIGSLTLGSNAFAGEPIYQFPQIWLSNQLKAGKRPTYESDAWIERRLRPR